MKIRFVLLLNLVAACIAYTASTFPAAAEEMPARQPDLTELSSPSFSSQPQSGTTVVSDKNAASTPISETPVIEDRSYPANRPGQQQSGSMEPVSQTAPQPAYESQAYLKSSEENTRVYSSVDVLRELTGIPEGISPSLLRNAYGIVIIPGHIKLGFFFGGHYGNGIAIMRNEDGTWSNPAFVYLAGGSFGLQIGAVSSDIILVFKTRKSIMGLAKGNFTLGADAAVAAGPVGRRAEASTDWQLKAEIYSYARSRGLFAGISLDGTALAIDTSANATFYGRPDISASEVFALPPYLAPAVIKLKDQLTKTAAVPYRDK
jgi:lipid-binding SYLF domain-containing protein